MAKTPMVTRTIKSTHADILAVNIDSEKTETTTMVLPRTYKDNQTLLKKAIALNEDENLKLVSVQKTEVIEEKYGMTEARFIELAEVLG